MSRKKLLAKEKHKIFTALKNKERIRAKSRSFSPAMKPFEDHPFYKNLMKHAIVPLWEENRKAKKENREITNLNEELKFHFRVFEYAGALYEGLKRLHDIPLFMQKGFSLRWMGNVNIKPQEWFIYHYANYRVIATGILDTALLVVNDVLELGMEPRKISKISFLGKIELAQNGISPSLKKLDQLLEKHRQDRNKYVHRSTRPEIDFVDNLYAYQLLKEAKEKKLYKGELPTQTKAQNYYAEERDKKAAEMREGTTEIFSVVIELLDALNPIYLQKIKSYSKASV